MTTTRTARPTTLHTVRVAVTGATIRIDIAQMNTGNWETTATDGWRVVTVAWNVTRDEAVSAANAEADALRTANFASSVFAECDYDDEEDD